MKNSSNNNKKNNKSTLFSNYCKVSQNDLYNTEEYLFYCKLLINSKSVDMKRIIKK